MDELETLHRTYGRLVDGEPIRLLIGHALHRSTEIELVPAHAARLRQDVTRDIIRRIVALQTPPDDPASTALPVPAEGGASRQATA